MIQRLRYSNTNTFYIPGNAGGLLVDTDYAGTLPLFFKAIKGAGIDLKDITYVLATHYHPDHIGLVGELQKLGITLLLVDVQVEQVHFSDPLFLREKRIGYVPVNETVAKIISADESRAFLKGLGIDGEIISTPSHSPDGISLILDDGICIVGDLEPLEYLDAYEDNAALRRDWERIMRAKPQRILYAHVNEKKL